MLPAAFELEVVFAPIDKDAVSAGEAAVVLVFAEGVLGMLLVSGVDMLVLGVGVGIPVLDIPEVSFVPLEDFRVGVAGFGGGVGLVLFTFASSPDIEDELLFVVVLVELAGGAGVLLEPPACGIVPAGDGGASELLLIPAILLSFLSFWSAGIMKFLNCYYFLIKTIHNSSAISQRHKLVKRALILYNLAQGI